MTSEDISAPVRARLSPNMCGALWMLGSCFLGAVMSATIKEIGFYLPSFQIVFLRCLVGTLLVLPFLVKVKEPMWHRPARNLLIWRALLGAVAMNCGFYTLTKLELTTATLLFFTAPLFVILFAAALLREVVGPRRWTACAIGFAGTMVVLRPGMAELEWPTIAALASSVGYALSLVIGKQLARTEPASLVLAYTMAISTLASLPAALYFWQGVEPIVWTMVLVAALAGTARALFDYRAYGSGDASFVAPFQYTRLIMVVILAYVLFQEVPDVFDISGGLIIVGAGAYIAWRDAKLSRIARTQPAPGP